MRSGPPALRIVALAAVVILIAAAAAPAVTLDDRVYGVARQLLCPVCQGQTVAESDSTVAREMRAVIRRKLAAGETPDQILRYFVGQFGESVLAEPPRRGVSWILYAGPFAALACGLALAAWRIRRWARGARAAPPMPPAVDPADLDRLARDLDALER